MSLNREGHSVPQRDRAVWQAWIALFGPVMLYVVYFTLVYLFGEAACKLDRFHDAMLLGLPLVQTFSVILALVCLGGLGWLWQLSRRVGSMDDHAHQFMGQAGVLMCGLSAILFVVTVIFIIAVTPCNNFV